MQKVAFIGIGAMGEPMVGNLLKKGFAVTIVAHRRPEPVERLKALGASVAESPAAAMRGADLAILALPTSNEVEAVVEGPGGLLEGAAPGAVIVDCTTSDPESTRRLGAVAAVRKVGFVDAGLTRGVAGAKQGKLAYFVGGDAAQVEKAKPALLAMGDTLLDQGALGNGHAAKIISNVLSYTKVAAVNDALMLGKAMGLDMAKLHDALMAGATSKALEGFGPRIVAREYSPPRVTIDHAREDIELIGRLAAARHLALPMIEAAGATYERVESAGHGSSDLASLAELWPRAQ